jgi:UPF0755 protein
MSKRSFRIALVVVVVTLVAVGGVALYMWRQIKSYPHEARAGKGVEVAVAIEPGMSFPRIAERLEKAGVIDNARWFRLYAMQEGATTRVRVGEYKLMDNWTPEKVLATLLEGVKDVTVTVKIPEGLNMLEVLDLIAAAGVADRAALEKAARDPAFLQKMGIAGETVEGYLFPETYKLKVPSTAEDVLGKLIQQHRTVWDRVMREHADGVAKLRSELKWGDREILIMASIVEKEAVIDIERPRIAQVFINRLTDETFEPKLLQTDPTIRYGCTVPVEKTEPCQKWLDGSQDEQGRKMGRLRRAQLNDKDNRYNTYQHVGLPPGPIGNPGEKSLVATVTPDGSEYFYFVAKDDHSHVFAKTVQEHERNVDKYMR